MKWSIFFVFFSISSQLFISCSNDSANEETVTTSSATSSDSPSSPTAEAKEKKADAEVKGLKGKVEVLSETVYQAGPPKRMTSKSVFKYDDKGNIIELSSYLSDGKKASTTKSIYNESGKLIKEETILGNGTVDLTSEILTDAKGNRIEQKDTRVSSNTPLFNHKYYFKYDEKGQLIERSGFRSNGHLFFKYNFNYDANGNRIEWIQTGPDSTVIGKVNYKYDDKNNLIEETVYRQPNIPTAVYTYSYEFDRKGNWKRQNKLQDGKLVEIRERSVTYH